MNEKMKYYTEGFIKSITVGQGKAPVKADKIEIEVSVPYKIPDGEKNLLLFIAETSNNKDNHASKPTKALIVNEGSLERIDCKRFDAQFLIVLKQTHSKVRVVLDEKLATLEYIEAK